MSGVFDKMKTGLEEAIAYEQGRGPARTTKMTITPVHRFTAAEIKTIRQKAGMTQATFAQYMGVTKKTVEAWEHGTNQPSGTACRLLKLTDQDPGFPEKGGIVVQVG